MRILLIEDGARLQELLCEAVRDAGWRIDAFGTAEDGLEVLRSLRHAKRQIPMLVLTARGVIDERIAGLDAGADDYLAKPFHNGELIARVRALMRRLPVTTMSILEYTSLSFDLASQQVCVNGVEIALAPSEKSLLELLMRHAGKVVSKQKMEHAFFEFGGERSSNAVDLAVSRLRKKLEFHPADVIIETVRGVGYLLREARR